LQKIVDLLYVFIFHFVKLLSPGRKPNRRSEKYYNQIFSQRPYFLLYSELKEKNVEKNYLYGLILMPFLGWSGGTLIGAIAGNILPEIVISSLGVAIYGMFIAIVVPVVKTSRPTALCVLIAVLLSCAFEFLPVLNKLPGGFVIIICAVVASALMAVISPIGTVKEDE